MFGPVREHGVLAKRKSGPVLFVRYILFFWGGGGGFRLGKLEVFFFSFLFEFSFSFSFWPDSSLTCFFRI